MWRRRWSWLYRYLVIQLFLLVAGPAPPALAHTEEALVQLSQAPVGPYRATVWTYPGMMRAGTIHFTVSLLDTAVAQPLNNATVIIEATPLAGPGAAISGQAVQGVDDANPFFYETDLLLKESGSYQVKLILQASSGRVYTQSFQVEVIPATSLKFVTALLLAQMVAFAAWFFKESLQTWGLNKPFVINQAAWAKTRARTRPPN